MLNFFKKKDKQAEAPVENISAEEKPLINKQEEEIAAAISMALSMYLREKQEYEKMILTIQRVMRPYSPWSSKIYGLRQYPRK